MVSVGDKVRIARDSKFPPVSMRELARLTGLTKGKINMWESGRTMFPRREDIEKVAAALEVPVEWFYDGQPGQPPKEAGNGVRIKDPNLIQGFAVTAAVRCWASATAGISFEEEAHFTPVESPHEIPTAFLVGGTRNIDRHDLVSVSGQSMTPIIEPGDQVLFFQDSTPRRNTVVMAECPEGRVYIKALRYNQGRWTLESLNASGIRVDNLTGWKVHGYAVAIMRDPEGALPNIVWPFGQPIKV